ncbi:hypothetical protein KCV03_g375, partial [Aureobasidium melanogenum]
LLHFHHKDFLSNLLQPEQRRTSVLSSNFGVYSVGREHAELIEMEKSRSRWFWGQRCENVRRPAALVVVSIFSGWKKPSRPSKLLSQIYAGSGACKEQWRAFRNNIFVLSLKFYSIKTLHSRNTLELLKRECRMKSQNIWVSFGISTIAELRPFLKKSSLLTSNAASTLRLATNEAPAQVPNLFGNLIAFLWRITSQELFIGRSRDFIIGIRLLGSHCRAIVHDWVPPFSIDYVFNLS